jgi:hypothetical protein
MAKQDIDKEHVRISVIPPPNSALKQIDDVYIVITQAFCPDGHPLIGDDNELFDGYPGLKVLLKSENSSGEIVLSPFHGDESKKGAALWADGEKVEICCPECGKPFPRMASCSCPGAGDLIKIYTTTTMSDSNILAMCNVWGCRRSRTINNWQIISEYFDGQIKD